MVGGGEVYVTAGNPSVFETQKITGTIRRTRLESGRNVSIRIVRSSRRVEFYFSLQTVGHKQFLPHGKHVLFTLAGRSHKVSVRVQSTRGQSLTTFGTAGGFEDAVGIWVLNN